VFEAPAFEPSLVPVFDPASVAEVGEETKRRRPADLSEVAAAWRKVIEQRSLPERPADLGGYVGQAPQANLAGRAPEANPAGQGSRGEPAGEVWRSEPGGEVWRSEAAGAGPRPEVQLPKPSRPTDLGSYTAAAGSRRPAAARPADLGPSWQRETWRRPEHLGDEVPTPRPPAEAPKPRRPATLADHLPVQRRPGDGPRREGAAEPEEQPEARR
jgi:hypothetical protein